MKLPTVEGGGTRTQTTGDAVVHTGAFPCHARSRPTVALVEICSRGGGCGRICGANWKPIPDRPGPHQDSQGPIHGATSPEGDPSIAQARAHARESVHGPPKGLAGPFPRSSPRSFPQYAINVPMQWRRSDRLSGGFPPPCDVRGGGHHAKGVKKVMPVEEGGGWVLPMSRPCYSQLMSDLVANNSIFLNFFALISLY